MKVRVLLNIGTSETDLPPLTEGEHEVSKEIADRLVSRGRAEIIQAVPSESQVLLGVPPARAVAEEKRVSPSVPVSTAQEARTSTKKSTARTGDQPVTKDK